MLASPAMPLQNRVDPYGALHATKARGAWMGNRGVLHDADRRIVRVWRLPRWITCFLSFRDRRREVFAPNRYSELFFLDEATSLAAGHRPCAECRRARYEEFRETWGRGRVKADELDRVLHGERLEAGGAKRTYRAALSFLPDGTMVEHRGKPHLFWRAGLHPWSLRGYGPAVDARPGEEMTVLTPRSIVGAIRRGFVPQIAGRFD